MKQASKGKESPLSMDKNRSPGSMEDKDSENASGAVPLSDMDELMTQNVDMSSVESLVITEEHSIEDTATLLSTEEEGNVEAAKLPVLKCSHKILRILLHVGFCVVGIVIELQEESAVVTPFMWIHLSQT